MKQMHRKRHDTSNYSHRFIEWLFQSPASQLAAAEVGVG
jgi:hypothetical protein